jgi:hypothetical protein
VGRCRRGLAAPRAAPDGDKKGSSRRSAPSGSAAGPAHDLGGLLALRRPAVEAELERLAVERERGMREGYLRPSVSPLQAAAFRRGELRAQAELAWHQE